MSRIKTVRLFAFALAILLLMHSVVLASELPTPEPQDIIDDICIVKDEEAIQVSKDLASQEGIMCGISSGTNVAAAMRLAKLLGKGKTVVTVLPDTAERYFSTPLFE